MKVALISKKDTSLLIIMLIWLIVIIFVVTCTITTSVSVSERKLPVYSVERDDNALSLTFNCAWDDCFIDEVLGILKKHDIKCTFFFVGEFAEKYPEAVRKIYNAGHEIGNHSMHHNDPVKQEYDELLSDINACNELLYSITGSTVKLYRAPSGSYDNKTVEAAESLGMTAVQWDCDSIDWKKSSPEKIKERVMRKAAKGSIVLFHLGLENTADALEDIIVQLKKQQFTFATVSQLLITEESYIDNNGRQQKKL